ncbi:MAG: twin-arginine translocase subunit TatC [Phycisphaerales bacterium]
MTPDTDQTPSLPGRKAPKFSGPHDSASMSFGDHLEELRRRLIWAVLGIVPLFFVAFAFGRDVLDLLIEPARQQLRAGGQATALLATGPFETFGAVVQIAMIITVLVGSPWLLYQLWLFVAPGLYRAERQFFYRLAPMSVGLTVLSMVFLYFVILPVVLAFFIGFGSKVGAGQVTTAPLPDGVSLGSIPVLAADPPPEALQVGSVWINDRMHQLRICEALPKGGRPVILGTELTMGAGIVQQYKIADYIQTLLNLALAFGIGFQMPVVVLLLGWVGIVTRQGMRKYRKHAIAACAFAGAALSPPDPLSMILLAVPLYALYELGMVLLKVWPPSYEKFEKEQA